MKIEFTKVQDQNKITLDSASKILFADKIIAHFSPLFYEDLRKKQQELKQNAADISKLKVGLEKLTADISKRDKEVKIEKIKLEVLDEIKYLTSLDVIYGSIRETIKNILLTLDSQTAEELTKNLKILQRSVNKTKK